MSIVDEFRDRIAHIVCEPDKGMYDAMNKGIALSTGDVIGTLNSDDFYESETSIAKIVDVFERNEHVDLAFGNVVFVDPRDLNTVVRYVRASRFRPWKLRFGWMPPHPASFIRSTAYDRVGGYSLAYKISADYEWFVRLLINERRPFACADSVIVRMRTGGASTAGIRNSYLLNCEIVRACRDNGVYTNLPLVMTKIPLKLLQLRRPTRHTTA
jgi:glycosyltransferase involved in cell wall biosynthesis